MVYVTGDTHGDITRFKGSEARKLRKGDTLIVLGDFGFIWENSKKENRILKKLARLRYNVLFIDGAHENYDLLNEYNISEWNKGRVRIIEGSVMHLMRGEIYTIEQNTYFVFGGGQSPDQDLREYDSKELHIPSEQDMLNGLKNLEQVNNTVDYILTHEFPGLGSFSGGRQNGTNSYLAKIESSVSFKRWFFGSLHVDKPMGKRLLAVFCRIVPVNGNG